jgi:hypothetical protein
MAPRPGNTTPPVTPTTQPPKQSGLRNLGTVTTPAPTATTVPTPTTVPATTSKQSGLRGLQTGRGTSVSGITIPTPISRTPDVFEAQKALQEQTSKAVKAGVPTSQVQEIVTGEEPNAAVKVLGKVFNFDVLGKIPFTDVDLPGSFKPVKTVVAPALGALSTGGRFVISANEEAIDFFKQKVLREKALKYTATDYIPVHPQTGLPIAKVGDNYIRNWSDVINTPIPGIDAAKTPEEAQVLQSKVVESKARTTAPSFGDIKKATKDFSYSASDNPYVPETGNAIIDGIIDFSYDVLLDPVTYATLGGSAFVAPIKAGAKGATKASAAAAARQAAEVAAAEAAQTAARLAVDPLATAAQKATAQAAAEAAEAAAEQAFKKAAAVAPRRVYGRQAREALANNMASARIAAQQILDDAASTAGQKAVAEQALTVLTDDFIQEVAAKGYAVIRGEAARVLGVRSGARIGIPFGPKVTIPFTNKLTDFFGTALSGSRFAVFKTDAGQKILNGITPTGEGGLFGSTDILTMRNALRSKNVPANVAADYVQLLAADTAYRGALDLQRKLAGTSIRSLTSGKNAKVLQDISQHLSTPESSWTAAGLRALSAQERAVYDQVRNVLDKFYREANAAAGILGAGPLAKLPDYFPRVQSTQAIEWASKNAGAAAKAAGDLGVDRTFFLGNFTPRALDRGKVWFGNVLDGTETTAQLNDLARPTLGFDFFEMDPAKALAAYGQNHAKYVAYATALDKLTTASPAKAGGLAQDISMLTPEIKTGTKPDAMQLGTLQSTLTRLMNPDRLQLWNQADVLAIRSDIAALQSKLAGASPIDREAFQEAILELDEKILATDRLVQSGAVDPTMGSLLRAEIEDMANGLALAINNTTRDFLVTSPSRWESVQRVVLDGFNVLNTKTIPDVAVRNEVLEIFNNVKRLDDPGFVRAADALLRDYNTFFKSYVTLTPGFHLRNALTNTFMMIAAGGNPINLIRARKIYSAWNEFAKTYKPKVRIAATQKLGEGPFIPARAIAKEDLGQIFDDFIKFGLNKKIIKPGEEAAVREGLAFSGATGFGQFGEIADAAGIGRPGVFGTVPTGTLPIVTKVPGLKNTIFARPIPGAKTLSQIAGSPIYGSRQFGQWLEGVNRFMLTFDGLQQGFDAATAAARTQKYLIDYNDLSTADRLLKQIIPFWTWASRNTPLQIENMWLNPKAYATYNKFRQNLRDEENESPFLRQYRAEAGAFKVDQDALRLLGQLGGGALGGLAALTTGQPQAFTEGVRRGGQLAEVPLYLQPDLGFPGAGQPGLVEEAFTDPEKLLSRITPIPRVVGEIYKNKQFFSGAPVTDKRSADANFNRFTYALRQVGAPISLLARYANFTSLRRFEFMQKIAGTKSVSNEQDARNQEINAGLSLFGLPFFQQLPEDEKKEIWRRFFLLLDETDKAEYQKREEEKKNK